VVLAADFLAAGLAAGRRDAGFAGAGLGAEVWAASTAEIKIKNTRTCSG